MARGPGIGVGVGLPFRRKQGPAAPVVPGFRDLAAEIQAASSFAANLNAIRNVSATFAASSTLAAALDVQAGAALNGPAATYFTAADVIGAWRMDQGQTIVTGLSSWVDYVNGVALAQATTGSQPVYTANDGTLNNRASATFDGTDDRILNNSGPLDRPAPGTEPTFMWLIFKTLTWTNGTHMCGTASLTLSLSHVTSTPDIKAQNGAVGTGNSGAAVGAWTRGEVLFSDSASDYLKLGSTINSGSSFGNSDPGVSFNLGSRGVGAFCNYALAEFVMMKAAPTAPQRAAADAYVANWYGGTVAI